MEPQIGFLQAWILKYSWLIELLVFFALILIVNQWLQRLFSKFKERKHLKENDWRFSIDYATLAPMRTLLWILFSAFLIDLCIRYFGMEDRISTISHLRNVGVVACLAWFFLRWKSILQHAVASHSLLGKSTLKSGSIEVIGKFFTITVLFVSLLLILQIFGLNVAPLIAFGGIGAAALGFASKDVIANFYGGFMIHVTRPFMVNDLVELPEKRVMGHVEEIGWYFTTVRDLQKKPIYIPNAVFSTEYLINQSRMTHRRIDEKIGLRFGDIGKVESLIDKIRQLLSNHPDIDSQQAIHVYVLTFGVSSIDLEIKAYTFATRYETYMEVKQAILLKIYGFIQELGAEMPFPTTEVLLRTPL